MKILSKEILAQVNGTRTTQIVVSAPDIANNAKPGQFVVLMVTAQGERVPLTIVDKDKNTGTITLIFQEIGFTTKLLGKLKVKSSLFSLTGPLGKPTEIKNYGKVIIVGGGVGIAEAYPVARALKEVSNEIISILGARTKDLVILKDEVKEVSDKLFFVTDDGSLGEKGLVTDVLMKILKEDLRINLVYCVGPVIMMRKVSELTKEYKIKTVVSLNTIMLDGTGMCGSCRLKESGKTKFCCVDGPEFDGHAVDFNELSMRQKRFLKQERESLKRINP